MADGGVAETVAYNLTLGGVPTAILGVMALERATRKTEAAQKLVGAAARKAYADVAKLKKLAESVAGKKGDATGGGGGGSGKGGLSITRKVAGVGEVMEHGLGQLDVLKRFAMAKLNLPRSLDEAIDRAWALNEALDQTKDKIVGMTIAGTNVGDTMGKMLVVPDASRVAEDIDGTALAIDRASAAADELHRRFVETALDSSIAPEKIHAAFASLQPVLGSLGKDYLEIAKATDLATKAATVYGTDAEAGTKKVLDLILKGKTRGKDPFALALGGAAGIKKGDDLEARFRKVNAALEKLSQPIGAVTSGTEEAVSRWKYLTDDVLQRATKPAYDEIGSVIQTLVDYTREHKDAIDAGVVEFQEMSTTVVGLVEQVASGAWFLLKWSGIVGGVTETFKMLWGTAKGGLDTLHQVFVAVSEVVDYLANPSDGGVAKLDALMKGVYLRLLKIVEVWGEWLQQIPGLNKIFPFERATKHVQQYIVQYEKDLAKQEAKVGLRPELRSTGKPSETGMSSADRDKLLKGVVGNKRPLFEMKVDKIVVEQNFRDADPDRVAIELVQDLERVGQIGYQSSIGGRATAFGPGGSL